MSKIVYEFDEPAIGTDAEGFLSTKTGEAVPAIGILEGDKDHPTRIERGGYLVDCVAWEINPVPVPFSSGHEEFYNNIRACISEIGKIVRPLNLKVSIEDSLQFEDYHLQQGEANVSGCSPSKNAWTRMEIDPIDLTLSNYRFAGGDVHISWPDADKYKWGRINLIRMMDAILGLNEVIYCPRSPRIYGYGMAGNHRVTDYGVEYKSIGNFWIKSPRLVKWMFEASQFCLNSVMGNMDRLGDRLLFTEEDGFQLDAVVNIRNTWNKEAARRFLRKTCPGEFWLQARNN